MVQCYVKHGMVVTKVHENFSFKQSKCLEKYNSFNTQKRDKAKKDFEKSFLKLLVDAAFVKFLEDVRNRLKIEIIKKDDIKNIINQQSKLTFNGIHKSYENCDGFTFNKTK